MNTVYDDWEVENYHNFFRVFDAEQLARLRSMRSMLMLQWQIFTGCLLIHVMHYSIRVILHASHALPFS
jgi:hypothetical protein